MKFPCQRSGAWLLLAGWLPLAALAASPREIQKELDAVSHRIAYVATLGQWQAGAQRGTYRLVLVDAKAPYPHSQLFIQWIGLDARGEPADMVDIRPVDEINRPAVYQLSLPDKDARQGTAQTLQLKGVNQYAHTLQEFTLSLGQPGEYRLQYGQTSPAGSDSRNVSQAVERAVRSLPVALDYYARPTF